MEKMREEFEAFAISDMGYMVARSGDGYKCDYMNTAWLSWKASRSALCIELPSKINDDNDLFSYGFDSAISSAEVSLENAGVSYK